MGKRLGTLAPSLLDRAAGKVKQRGRHSGRLSAVERHALRKSLKKLCYDVESLAGLYRPHAVKIYRVRCEALEDILGVGNDVAVTPASGSDVGHRWQAGSGKAGGRSDAMEWTAGPQRPAGP